MVPERDVEKAKSVLMVNLAPLRVERASAATSGASRPPSSIYAVDPVDPGETEVINIRKSNLFFRWINNVETWLDLKLNFEAMGVERIPENKRSPPKLINVSDLDSGPCWLPPHDAAQFTCMHWNVLTLYCRWYSSGSPCSSTQCSSQLACSVLISVYR